MNIANVTAGCEPRFHDSIIPSKNKSEITNDIISERLMSLFVMFILYA